MESSPESVQIAAGEWKAFLLQSSKSYRQCCQHILVYPVWDTSLWYKQYHLSAVGTNSHPVGSTTTSSQIGTGNPILPPAVARVSCQGHRYLVLIFKLSGSKRVT